MISGVYGLPLYKGKISNTEKFFRYIENCKTGKSDVWNAECMTSSNDGSTKIKSEDTTTMDRDVFDEICLHGETMMKEIGLDISISPCMCKNVECKDCIDVWVNKYTKGHSQGVHWHVNQKTNALFSFVYFAKYDSERDAKLTFVNFMPEYIECEEMREHLTFSRGFRPDVEEGDILIFPSWLLHFVDEQKHDETRITVAGNFYQYT